jgi:hypothetical protein
MWAFLNWALGLRHLGCRVIWLDSVLAGTPEDRASADVAELIRRLKQFGLGEDVLIISHTGESLPFRLEGCLDPDASVEADLFLNLGYDLPARVVKPFRRSAFVDIDPGLTQTWMSLGQLKVAAHDLYFTYGESVVSSDSKVPNSGVRWLYTPPAVFLSAWPTEGAEPGAPYTTISTWWGESDWVEISGQNVDNSKRAAFLPYLELPLRVSARLELSLPLTDHEDDVTDRILLESYGWRVRRVDEVSSTPEAFRSYVQRSRGEFSCMKRGYVVLETAWTSERTLNYLASGKPAIVQYTGPSRFLPDAEGIFRFRNMDEAVKHLRAAEDDYERHSKAARALAEEYFDARKVVASLLERALS